jgi:hypothetical protein
VSERDQKTLLTGCEADDPNVEEVEVGDPRLGLVDLVQPAPGAPLAVLLPPRQQWRRRADVLAAGHLLITLSLSLWPLQSCGSREQLLVNEGGVAKTNPLLYQEKGADNSASSVMCTCGLRYTSILSSTLVTAANG